MGQAAELGAPLAQIASAPQPPATAPQSPVPPPFQITAIEQQHVDQILQMWENESSKVNTFSGRFEQWEYDLVFGPGTQIPAIKSSGLLTYSKPDKGSFEIKEIRRYQPQDPNAQPQDADWVLQESEVGAHWVCDGKAVFEYKHENKQLVVQPLPPNMQGKEIVNGPLPFLFGAKAEELKRRYWIRSKQGNPETIWLEAYPRTQADAANYHHVEVILNRKSMQPQAIKVHAPNNQSHSVYMFDKPTINGKLNALFGSLFSAPRTPFGWKRVVQEMPPTNPQAANPQSTTTR
jgi:TIGR03009 family protein